MCATTTIKHGVIILTTDLLFRFMLSMYVSAAYCPIAFSMELKDTHLLWLPGTKISLTIGYTCRCVGVFIAEVVLLTSLEY